MTITPTTIERLLKEQHNHCRCGRSIPPFEAHHAIYTRDKNFSKWLDMPENLILLCPTCHRRHGELANWFMRSYFWTRKIEMGYDMHKWHNEIPMLIKDKFYEFEHEEENGKG